MHLCQSSPFPPHQPPHSTQVAFPIAISLLLSLSDVNLMVSSNVAILYQFCSHFSADVSGKHCHTAITHCFDTDQGLIIPLDTCPLTSDSRLYCRRHSFHHPLFPLAKTKWNTKPISSTHSRLCVKWHCTHSRSSLYWSIAVAILPLNNILPYSSLYAYLAPLHAADPCAQLASGILQCIIHLSWCIILFSTISYVCLQLEPGLFHIVLLISPLLNQVTTPTPSLDIMILGKDIQGRTAWSVSSEGMGSVSNPPK